MKKQLLTLLAVTSVLFYSCSKEDKAKKSIKEYLSKTMHDFKSYEPVEYGTLDSSYSDYKSSDIYKKKNLTAVKLMDSVEKLEKKIEQIENKNQLSKIKYYDWYEGSKFDNAEREEMLSILKVNKEMLLSVKQIYKTMSADSAAFKPEFNGYKMSHTFRGKNITGATIINTEVFHMNKAMDKVTDTFKEK
ncbi:hypothetical protein [Pedobacter caeni]|uniref:Uncharacterized protein n=1 Tax=Pedobacter caeni TaxID=288992 RepID=A0A1M5GVL9_9SPHI|nr:hypothetical protein [Pedobacter caeni]SHG07750.1 hypothetical protein SAMN04488522_104388 [Pedobacter caeni]